MRVAVATMEVDASTPASTTICSTKTRHDVHRRILARSAQFTPLTLCRLPMYRNDHEASLPVLATRPPWLPSCLSALWIQLTGTCAPQCPTV